MLTINLLHTQEHVAADIVRCRKCFSLVARSQTLQRTWHTGWCRPCHAASVREYRHANRDLVSADNARAYAKRIRTRLWENARTRARAKGVPFDIEPTDIEIPERCPVLGIEFRFERGAFMPASPSLDRIVPSRGYVRGNIAVISNRANMLKRDATLAEVEALAAWMRRRLS